MKFELYNLATMAQWAIFIAIIASAWGVLEKKEKYAKIGLYLFLLAGVIAIGTIAYLPTDPNEMADGTLSRIAQLKMLSIPVSSIALTSLLAVLSIRKYPKVYRIFYFITATIGIIMFFQYYRFLHGLT